MSLFHRRSRRRSRGPGGWIEIGALLAAVSALAIAPALAVSPAPPQSASYFPPSATGEVLWRECGSSTVGPPPTGCWAYVAGVVDGAQRIAANGLCLPRDVDASELANAVRRQLAADPKSRASSAATVVIASLRHDFPCKAAS